MVVDQGDAGHGAAAVGLGRLPVEPGLHALRPGDLQARPRQVDRMRRQRQALTRGQAVAEFQFAGGAVDSLGQQQGVGEPDFDRAGGDRIAKV